MSNAASRTEPRQKRVLRLAQISQRRLSEQAYLELKRGVLKGEIPPGSTLAEAELAEAMSISRTPVREALALLRSDGLIELTEAGGHVVRRLGAADLEELFLIREALEHIALRRYLSITTRNTSPLHSLIQRQREAAADGDVERFLEFDEEFHLTISRDAQLPHVQAMLRSLRDRMHLAGLQALAGADRTMLHVVEEHTRILHAAEANDALVAERAMRNHLIATKTALGLESANEPSRELK